ncbi:hypothetical protein BDQ17DRAFT_1360548 [Cyathus striatus]|nr:hypothetical protein BDQ17DRAFT_1360548 [Cyathus striatus]
MVATGTLLLGGVRVYGRTTLIYPPQFRSNARSFASIIQHSSITIGPATSRRNALTIFAARSVSTSTGDPATVSEKLVELQSAPIATPVATASNTAEVVTNASATDVVNAVVPLNYGDLSAMGFVKFGPSGLIQWTLEAINVTTHMPWFYTIIAGSLFWKLVTLYPNLAALRQTGRMSANQEEINRIKAGIELQNGMAIVLNYRSSGQCFVQVPIALGIFFGVRDLTALPLAQMTVSGFPWVPDLTVADPTHILPMLFMASANYQIYLAKTDASVATRPTAPHVMNAMHLLTILPGCLAFSSWPSGLTLALTATSVFYTIQTLMFRMPAFRARFGLAPLITAKPKTLYDSLQHVLGRFSPPEKKQPKARLR